MHNIFLTGHVGSMNHGCEAIVRSTVEVLKQLQINNECFLYSFDKDSDLHFHLNEIISIRSYNKRNLIQRIWGRAMKLIGFYHFWQISIQRDLWNNIKNNDICLNIGGDIYCYPGCAYTSYELNKEIYGRAKSVFWGCSLEKN